MTVTANRLGSAPITLDWTHLLGAGEPDLNSLSQAWDQLKKRFQPNATGLPAEVGFYDTPILNELSFLKESQELANKIVQSHTFTDCLVLGIGGSALGPISLLASLQEKCTTGIRFHFVENPDPMEWKTTLHQLKPETTLVCVITKSGTTFETLAQTLLALEWLGKPRWKTHLVAITDPTQGDLRAFVQQEGIPSLPIAPSIGGRFSIFSPVGLFPAALAGLSPQSFLNGAKQARDYIEKTPVQKNPIFILANELIRQYQKRPIHIVMPYSTRLRSFGTWFVQLWGESLGKDGKGFTPLAALGATDQHSILQLLRDGPDNKMTFFMTVDQMGEKGGVLIPKLPQTPGRASLPAFKILEGHSLQELLEIEYRATSLVLTKQARPHMTIRLDQLDERSLGALYFTFSTWAAFTGTLWNLNPFDQPGVEEGKVYIRQALSQVTAPSERELEEENAVERLRLHRQSE